MVTVDQTKHTLTPLSTESQSTESTRGCVVSLLVGAGTLTDQPLDHAPCSMLWMPPQASSSTQQKWKRCSSASHRSGASISCTGRGGPSVLAAVESMRPRLGSEPPAAAGTAAKRSRRVPARVKVGAGAWAAEEAVAALGSASMSVVGMAERTDWESVSMLVCAHEGARA